MVWVGGTEAEGVDVSRSLQQEQRMNRIYETPDEDERRRHDNFVRVVHPRVKRHLLRGGDGDETFDSRMPVYTGDSSLLTEEQVGE